MRKYNFSFRLFLLSLSIASFFVGMLIYFLYSLFVIFHSKYEKCESIKVITTDSSTVIAQKSKIMSLEKALKDKEIENTLLITKLKQQSQVKATTKIIEKKIPIYTQKVIIVDTNTFDSIDFIRVPYTLYYEDSFTFFKGTIDPLDFTLDSLIIQNELVVSVGDKKSKWWGKNEPYVEVKSTNPNTEIKVKSVEINQKKHFYKTFWFGAVVGSIVSAILIL